MKYLVEKDEDRVVVLDDKDVVAMEDMKKDHMEIDVVMDQKVDLDEEVVEDRVLQEGDQLEDQKRNHAIEIIIHSKLEKIQ